MARGSEIYTHGYEEWAREWMSQRSVADAAPFLLPHLRSGMRMLDCGCGPGSITIGLAAIADPGSWASISNHASWRSPGPWLQSVGLPT